MTEEGKMIYGKFKAGDKELPPGFDDAVSAEQAWVHQIMETRMKSRSATSTLAASLLRFMSCFPLDSKPFPDHSIPKLFPQHLLNFLLHVHCFANLSSFTSSDFVSGEDLHRKRVHQALFGARHLKRLLQPPPTR